MVLDVASMDMGTSMSPQRYDAVTPAGKLVTRLLRAVRLGGLRGRQRIRLRLVWSRARLAAAGHLVTAGMIAWPTSSSSVAAVLVGGAGDDHDQVQVGDDPDALAAEPDRQEAGVAGLAGHPPLVAVALGGTVGRWGAVRACRGGHVACRDHLGGAPAAAVEVQVADLGQVTAWQLQPAEAELVALGVGGPGHRRPLVGLDRGLGR